MEGTPPTGAEVRAAKAAAEHLAAQVTETLEKIYVPREEYEQHRRNVRLALAGGVLACVLFLGMVAVVVTAFFRFGDLIQTNDERIDVNRDLIDQIQECITPTEEANDPHECYARGQDGQKEAIEQLLAGINEMKLEILAAIEDQ
jgi:hypothetical protein